MHLLDNSRKQAEVSWCCSMVQEQHQDKQTPSPAMLQALLVWGVFATFLTPTNSQSCIKASESQCYNADFIPGSNLAGEGFDITTMERKGAFVIDMSSWLKKDKTCTLCKNPYMRGENQKLPASVVDWRPSQKCSMKVSSSVYHSSESLVSSSTASIENRWQQDLNLVTPKVQGSVMMAGTNSKLAKYSMQKTKNVQSSASPARSSNVDTTSKKYRVSNRPVLHPELSEEFKSLPQRYDKSTKHLYFKLIDMFGTHYITKVTLGGEIRSVTSIKECQASLQGLSVDEVKSCLDLEASESSIRAHLCNAIKDYILQRALVHNCASPCKTGIKTNPKEPCSCSCHNNPGVALNCCPTQKGFAHVTVTIIKATGLHRDYFGQTDGYVKILLNVQVNCITGLTGSSCTQYNPSPMDSQLKKVYISRNAYPIPRDMLLEMGVLLDKEFPAST
ncbi:hypothetical protein HF521_004230 [Silurus meridionalis]|uniref:MACPF domain-containing protein n=1 Tax=Silurus meridionalis TaxID=175797 RepID=A0A8T0AYJ3_SILME|nr:hypothetical protein HF521_004230 [Silurus meridionalis]